MMSITRQEYIKRVKTIALLELENGSVYYALTSLRQGLKDNPETENHPAIQLSRNLQAQGQLFNEDRVRKFIEGIECE